jgi:hypothetical protein
LGCEDEGYRREGSRCRAPIHAEVIVAEAFWQRNRVLRGDSVCRVHAHAGMLRRKEKGA